MASQRTMRRQVATHRKHGACGLPAMRDVALHRNALPHRLFRRLARSVRALGEEQLAESYTTNFWFALDALPRNVAEEAILRLCRMARPGRRCIGAERWLGRLRFGESLDLHFHRDMELQEPDGQVLHPLKSSILYLNRFDSSPTVVTEQTLGSDGHTLVPAVAPSGRAIVPEPNSYLVYRGDLYHGVIADTAGRPPAGLRLTLLANFWDRRPLPPVCRDYDGSVYAALQEQAA